MRVRTIPRSIPSKDGAIYDGLQTRLATKDPDNMNYAAGWKAAGAPIGFEFGEVATLYFLFRDKDFRASPLAPTEIDASPREQTVKDEQALTFEQEFT